MPIYEFHSPDTGKIYSFYAPSFSFSELVPKCPDGTNNKMVKLLSSFSITGKQKDATETKPESHDPDDPFAGMDENQANQMMKELENSISGMDEENPDPKQMGSLMRRMCELSGESMDAPMEEVVRKLEEGMNPEDLEERMGEFMGEESEVGLDHEGDEGSAQSKLRKLLLSRTKRDPELYDFREYL